MNKNSGSLYHLSEKNLDGRMLAPKVPSNYLTDNGFEDNTTKRVCFSTTIDGALAGLSKNLKDKEFYVHILDGKSSIKVPSEKDVPDVKITHERWALTDVRVKCIGKIKVGEAKDKPLTYKYGDKTVELYYWNWDWIETFNVKESCRDLSEARKFVSEVKDIAKKYDANFFIVTDGASGYSNDGTNDAVKNAREAQKKWEKEKGFDPDEDWSKESCITESTLSTKEINDINTIKKSLSPEDKKNLNMSSDNDYNTTGFKCFIEYSNGIPVAYAIVDIDENNDADISVACNPKYRGKGFAYKALKKAVDYARSHANNIYYATKANNISSQKLAKKAGLTNVVRDDKDWKTFSISESTMNESVIFDDKNIFHNKDKWDNGEINIVFITGHSGAAKSTTGAKMATESYSLDDVIEQYRFTDANFKEYGDLISSYFKGPGKEYRISLEEIQKTTTEKTYEIPVLSKFIDYAIKYAKSHKDKKFCIEGIQLFQWFEPSRFKDYPVIILGTSVLKSNHRASLRDAQDADSKLQKVGAYAKNILSPKHYINYLDDEKYLKKWRDYYKDDIVNESVSTFLDDTISKAERRSAEKKDYKDMMKLDGVRSPNKIADKVLKTSDKAVDKTMKALDKPAGAVNNATNKAIHKTVGGGISLYNKFAKKKVEAEKKREIEAKAGVAVKGAAFMATKLVPMGPVDWMLNLIAVTKVPKSDDPIDKEVQKVVTKAKDTLTDFRADIKKYAENDRKYASAKQQLKDLERIEKKYEPITKKLALAMDNIGKQQAEMYRHSINTSMLQPTYETTIDISMYIDRFDDILLSSDGRLLESSYDLLYDFIYEDGNDNYPIYEIVNHYLNL